MAEKSDEQILAGTFKSAQFLSWARDESGVYPFATTFDMWEEAGLVRVAEEGYALTLLGRRIAGLPTGHLKATGNGDSND